MLCYTFSLDDGRHDFDFDGWRDCWFASGRRRIYHLVLVNAVVLSGGGRDRGFMSSISSVFHRYVDTAVRMVPSFANGRSFSDRVLIFLHLIAHCHSLATDTQSHDSAPH